MNPPLTLAFASDETYLDGVVGTLSGVVRRAPGATIRVFILDCGIHDTSWDRLQQFFATHSPTAALFRLVITPERLRMFNPDNRLHRVNNSSYARLLLPELLPDEDRIIYLDCDLVVDADLRPLFATTLDGAPVAAVQDAHMPTLGLNIPPELLTETEVALPVFNSGVLLMDLAAMRRSRVLEQILALPPSFHVKFQDQSVLNYVTRGRWKQLPVRWNRQRFVTENFSLYRDHPDSVWHFIGKMKPWHFAPSFMRGLVADFHRDLVSKGWVPRLRGESRPLSPAWRDSIKAARASLLRGLRHARA